jgi:hypothetical protein
MGQYCRCPTNGKGVCAIWKGQQNLCWHAVSYRDSIQNLRMIEVDMFRLAYAELYITIGTLFRRFENLRGNELKPEDLVLDDYFASHHPIGSTKFHVLPPETQ